MRFKTQEYTFIIDSEAQTMTVIDNASDIGASVDVDRFIGNAFKYALSLLCRDSE